MRSVLLLPALLLFGWPAHAQPVEFIRGDTNSDGKVDISDGINTLGCLFTGGPCPDCGDRADANDDGNVDISDAVYTLNFLFTGGSRPPEPFPDPGFDPTTGDARTCGDAPPAESGDIVLSEIHYHPLSEDPDDEFLEIYNRGSTRAGLGGWKFTKGVDFAFPAGTFLDPGAYLVVARNAARIAAAYGISNVMGNYTGVLDDGGETVRLKDSLDKTICEVLYDDGGLWPRDADGYGSSLELVDLHGEVNSSQAWAASDESGKSEWTPFTIRQTARASSDELHLLLVTQGECLVDNLQVLVGGQNKISNGSFESGISGWLAQGTHRLSSVTTEDAVQGSRALHLVATGRGDTSPNRVECDLTSPVSAGQTVTIQGSARWLRGCRFLLVRLWGNAVAQSVTLSVPAAGGTSGKPNTARVENRGPDLAQVRHSPVLPTASQTVLVTAIATDVDGVSSVTLHYHVEPATVDTLLEMKDDGTGGDRMAGDGVFSATIPRQTSGRMVAFWVSAVDGAGAESRFPTGAPALTCLYRTGEPNPASSFSRYHVWMPAATVNALRDAPKMSNEVFDVTFVLDGTQVFYNAGIRYRGSPFIRSSPPTDPVGGRYAYRLEFGEHQPLNGNLEIDLDNIEPGRDPTIQREHAAYTLYQELQLPYSQWDYVRLWINGNDHGVYADVMGPSNDYVGIFWPDDTGGALHKVDDYFEYDDSSGFSNRDARLVDLGSDKEEYRWNFEKRDDDRNDDFSSIIDLCKKLNVSGAGYEAAVEGSIDVDEWVKVLAIERIIGNWDSLGYSRGKNMWMYRPPTEGRWKLIPWDMDFLLGNGDSISGSLFGGIDPAVNKLLDYPKYKKMYLRAFRQLVDGPFRNEFLDPILDETYASLRAEISVQEPSDVKSWIRQRRDFVLTQIPAAVFSILTNGGNDFSTSETRVTIEGESPLEVEAYRLNGAPLVPTITGTSRWSFTRNIPLGYTTFLVEGLDAGGAVVGSDSITVLRVEPCVPSGVEPASTPPVSLTLTIHGGGFVVGTAPAVRLSSASTEVGFNAFYAEAGGSFGDINAAEAFLDDPSPGSRQLETTHVTVSLRTTGGGEIFPTEPFPAPWNVDPNNLAARYTGFVHVSTPGERTFGVNSDDGFRLRINGQVVCEYAAPRSPAVTTGTYNFPAAGSYSLELDWYENGGGDIVQLFQEMPGGVRALINDGSEVQVTRDDPLVIQATNVTVVDDATVRCDLDLTGAPAGAWSLEVAPEQGSVCRLKDALVIQ